jgi:hypothetical protein
MFFWAGGVAQVVEHLPSKPETLKKLKKKKKKEQKMFFQAGCSGAHLSFQH